MRGLKLKYWGLVFSAILVSLFQNCSQDVNFSQDPSASGSGTCTLQREVADIKLLFVVDKSGSNNPSVHGLPGTDPGGVMRQGSIQEFFNRHKSLDNFSWGFITFSGSSAYDVISQSNMTAQITADPSEMQAAIDSFMDIPDNGATPYKAAINMARLAIQNDAQFNGDTKYVIVFLSDGEPTDYLGFDINPQLVSDVQTIMDLAPKRITFNTVYYGVDSATASERLHIMAQTGKGRFLDTNKNPNGKSFKIADVINVPCEE